MNKKELRNMKLLEATDELIKLAKEDVPVRDKRYYTEQLIYQRGLYLRAEVENNILKAAFYLAEYLSMDCRKISVSCTVGNMPEAIKSPNTFPAPTDGN